MASVARPLPTTRPKLGLDELMKVAQMISPEYPRFTSEHEARYFGLEPVLSKGNRTALCSLSLSCRGLREVSQRALMCRISTIISAIPEILAGLAARFQNSDNFPVRALKVRNPSGNSNAQDADKMIKLLKRCPELEFLAIENVEFISGGWDLPHRHFSRLVTFYCRMDTLWNPIPATFASIIATMPGLKNLITTALDMTEFSPPICQLETVVFKEFSRGNGIRWILSNSYESLHTLHLSWVNDFREVMESLTATLKDAGPSLRVLHIWGQYRFRPDSIASLIRFCPNLEDLGIPLFEADESFPVTVPIGGEEETGGRRSAIMLIINALRAPLRRLHIIWDHRYETSPPARGYRLPTLCHALQRGHEKLAQLELISLEVTGKAKPKQGKAKKQNSAKSGIRYFALDPKKSIVAVCKERGLRLRYSTTTDSAEY